MDTSHWKNADKVEAQRVQYKACLEEAGRSESAAVRGLLAMVLASGSQPDSAILLASDKKELGVNPTSRGRVIREGAMLRGLWDTHWCEEWCRLYSGRISLYRSYSRKPRLTLLLQELISVRAVRQQPVTGLHCFVIETASVVHCFCVRSLPELQAWLGAISTQVYHVSRESSQLVADARGVLLGMHRFGDQRVILNSRRLLRRPAAGCALKTAEGLLNQALELSTFRLPGWPQLAAFIDNTAWLKAVELEPLTLGNWSRQLVTFFLNLYHVLLIHTFLLAELPSAERGWSAVYNRFCYEVGGYVFSLAEIEHCVLRASMSKQSRGWLSKRKREIPKWGSEDPRSMFRVQHPDPRINFALNNGTCMCPPQIIVYDVNRLHTQLDCATSIYLEHHALDSSGPHGVVLPKVCEWYLDDFKEGTPEGCWRYLQGKLPSQATSRTQRVREIRFSDSNWSSQIGFSKFDEPDAPPGSCGEAQEPDSMFDPNGLVGERVEIHLADSQYSRNGGNATQPSLLKKGRRPSGL